MTPKDRRQYLLMVEVVRDAAEGRRTLSAAAHHIFGLMNALEEPEPEFVSAVTDAALTLESAGVHTTRGVLPPGVSLKQDGSVSSSGLAPFVVEALRHLERMAKAGLG